MIMTMRCSHQGARLARTTTGRSSRRIPRLVTRASETKDAVSTSGGAAPAPSTPPAEPSGKREFTSWGARIIESDEKLTGPEDQKDFWEGDNMETLGRVMERFFLPGLIVLGLIVGGIAARTYNDDADVFIAPPTGPDAEVTIIPAGALAPAPVVVEVVAPAVIVEVPAAASE